MNFIESGSFVVPLLHSFIPGRFVSCTDMRCCYTDMQCGYTDMQCSYTDTQCSCTDRQCGCKDKYGLQLYRYAAQLYRFSVQVYIYPLHLYRYAVQLYCRYVLSSLAAVFGFFETGFLCGFGACSGTSSVDQAGLELTDIHHSCSF